MLRVCLSPHTSKSVPTVVDTLTCKAPPSALGRGDGPEVPRVHRGGVESHVQIEAETGDSHRECLEPPEARL